MIHSSLWQLFDVYQNKLRLKKPKVDQLHQQIYLSTFLKYLPIVSFWRQAPQIIKLYFMGNSNLQLTQGQSTIQKEPSRHAFEVPYQNQLYGRYALPENSTETIVKVYVPQSHIEKNQLKDLIQIYQMARHPSIIPLLSFSTKQNFETMRFQLQLQRLDYNLKQDIVNKPDRYSEKEVISFLKSMSEALNAMKEVRLPFGLLTPGKIAVKNHQQTKYYLTSDHLMNPELYQLGFNLVDSIASAYLAPEEISAMNKQSKSNLLMSRNQHAVIFSLGFILLEMIFRETISKDSIQDYLIEMRRYFSYQLSQILANMLSHPQRHCITTLLQALNDYQTNLQRGVIRIGQYPIKRGYNSLQTLFFLDQGAILPAARAKLRKKSKVTC